jgi:protein O-GlcNAc transferase
VDTVNPSRVTTATGPEAAPPRAVVAPRRRWWVALLLVLVLLGGAVGFWVYRTAGPALPDVPAVDVAHADPEVAAAVMSARTAVLQKPRSAAAWGHLAMVLHAHEFFGEAITCYEVAGRLDPRNPLWPYLQGIVLQAGEDQKAALPYFTRAADLGSPNSSARLRLADLLLEQGRLEDAARAFETVLHADPDNDHARFGLGQLAVVCRQYREALPYLQAVADSPHARKRACALRAAVYEHLGETAAVERERLYLAMLPRDEPWPDDGQSRVAQLQVGLLARREQATQMIGQGRYREALTLLQDTVARYPESDLDWAALGQILIGAKDYAGAARALRQAIELAPRRPQYHYYLGMVRREQRRLNEAVEAFHKAIELAPADAQAYYDLGECLEDLGNRAGAADAFRQALRHRPGMDEARKHLAALADGAPGH